MAVTIINPEAIPEDLAPGMYCCRLDESSTLSDFRARLITPPRPHVPGDCLIQLIKEACPVCRDTGIVQCAETNPEDGVYEQACPAKVHDGQPCPICAGAGYVEGPGCNCGVGPAGYYGMHERHCGMEPCPRGCPFVGPAKPEEALF